VKNLFFCPRVSLALKQLMLRPIAVSVGLIALSSGYPYAAGVGSPGSCPRPSDQYGLRYQFVTGTFKARGKTQGGGKYVTIILNGSLKPPYPVSEMSVAVSGEVFIATGNLSVGTRVTLVGYVGDSRSGAMPPYSCIEFAL
jgi:hypothetical protein